MRPSWRSGGGGSRQQLQADTRSVSVTVNYALNLVVATLLVGGVLTATGGMVEDRRESAVRTELSVVGERVAADLMAADRLAQVGDHDSAETGEEPTVALSVSLPDRVAATRYEIAIETSPDRIVLTAENPDVEFVVRYRTDAPVAETTVRGGDLRIALDTDPDPNRLEVTEA